MTAAGARRSLEGARTFARGVLINRVHWSSRPRHLGYRLRVMQRASKLGYRPPAVKKSQVALSSLSSVKRGGRFTAERTWFRLTEREGQEGAVR